MPRTTTYYCLTLKRPKQYIWITKKPLTPNHDQSGIITAISRHDALTQLHHKGLQPDHLSTTTGYLNHWLFPLKKNDPLRILIGISTLLNHGLNLSQVVRSLQHSAKLAHQRVLIVLENTLQNGQPLSSALALYPQYFAPWIIQMIAMGEQTDHLPSALAQIIRYIQHQQQAKKKRIKALFYPVMVLITALMILWVMLIWVVPQFENMFQSLGGNLPLATQYLVKLSNLFKNHSLAVTLTTGFIGLIIYVMTQHPSLKGLFYGLATQLPLIKRLSEKRYLAMIFYMLCLAYGAGISLPESILMIRQQIHHPRIRKSLMMIHHRLLKGETISHALAQDCLYPNRLKS